MNETRTYGIEIECYVAYTAVDGARGYTSHERLVDRLNAVLAQFNHRCVGERYNHNCDATNYSRWSVKPDGSLCQPPQGCFAAEVVSPVLRGTQGLQVLKAVMAWLSANAKVNVTCGLHVHHGVQSNEVLPIARAWLAIENVVMGAMPASRKYNRFCQRWRRDERDETRYFRARGRNVPAPHESENFSQWYYRSGLYGERYVALNYESIALRNTVEFRCAAGTVEFDKASNWLLFTQAIVEAAVAGAPQAYTTVEAVCAYVTRANGATVEAIVPQRPHTKGSGYGNHKRGSMADYLDRAFTAGTAESTMRNVLIGMGRTAQQAQTKINGHIAYLRAQGLVFETMPRGTARLSFRNHAARYRPLR